MSVERIEITHQGPYADGQEFGDAGCFELIRARLHYAVNPKLQDHQRITDLEPCAAWSGWLRPLQRRPGTHSPAESVLPVTVRW